MKYQNQEPKGRFHSLRLKFVLMYTVVMIFIIVVLALLIGLKSAAMLKENAISNCMQELSFVNERLSILTQRLEGEVLSLTYQQAGVKESLQGFPKERAEYERISRTSGYLMEFLTNHQEIDSITFYQTDGSAYYRDNYTGQIEEKPNEAMESFLSEEAYGRWAVFPDVRKIPHTQGRIHYLKKANDFSGLLSGCFSIALSKEAVCSVFGGQSSNHISFFLLDSMGKVCYPDLSDVEEPRKTFLQREFRLSKEVSENMVLNLGGDQYTIIPSVIPQLSIMAAVSNAYIYQDARRLAMTIALAGLLFMVLCYFLFWRLTSRLIRPLDNVMEMVCIISDGNYNARAPVVSNDEIGRLAKQINLMAENTQLLMGKIRMKEAQKRKYELSYQQVQMQPHFLYNTLETVCGMVEMGDRAGAIGLISHMSHFYRVVLNRGEPIISIRKELDITEYYLKIMQKRYCNSFSYSIQAEDRLLEARVPKLILQPLVENAVVHGIVNCGYPGVISVAGYQQNGWVYLSVSDNGKGLRPEDQAQLEQQLHSEESEDHSFGISSIKKRLCLYLGEGSEILFTPNVPHGIKVTIGFPMKDCAQWEGDTDTENEQETGSFEKEEGTE